MWLGLLLGWRHTDRGKPSGRGQQSLGLYQLALWGDSQVAGGQGLHNFACAVDRLYPTGVYFPRPGIHDLLLLNDTYRPGVVRILSGGGGSDLGAGSGQQG